MKQLYLTIFFISFSAFAFAQTLNERQGTGSGQSLTTGDYNTFYGDSTGASVTSGHYNVFVGFSAGKWNTTSENVFVGYRAGEFNTTGFDNTFIGFESGRLNTTGSDNIFLGTESGENNTTGYDNTFVGEESGTVNTTGYENTFIGKGAGRQNTTGYRNTFVGNESGAFSNTGYRNTGVGNQALWIVNAGHHNTALGDVAGADVGDGNYNSFLGAEAGANTEYADYCTFVGAMAGWDNNRTNKTSNANRNTYVGYYNGYSNRDGEDNVGMGALANFDTTDRSRCTFIGAANLPGDNDVIMIGYSGYNDGQYAISIGNELDTRGTNSVGIGYKATMTANADYSIAIGNAASVNGTHAMGLGSDVILEGDSSMAIGYAAAVPEGITNSVAFGNHSTVTSSNAFVLGSNANELRLGIGTSSPNQFAAIDLGAIDRGLLLNRLTEAQIIDFSSDLGSSEAGLTIYDTDHSKLNIWNGSDWIPIGTDTDEQDLSLSDNTLSLTNDDSGVDLSFYLDNTDAQTLELSGTDLSITGGNTLSLASLQDGVEDADADPGNEYNTGAALNGTTLEITDGGGIVSVDLSALPSSSSDDQSLTGASINGTTLQIDIENGNSVSVDLASLLTSVQSEINDLKNRVSDLETDLTSCCTITSTQRRDDMGIASLGQNYPNPLTNSTTIEYYLPYTAKSARLVFVNELGVTVEEFELTSRGNGQLIIPGGNLSAGTYHYSLYVDGELIGTREMMVVK